MPTWFRGKRLLNGINQRFDYIDMENSFEHDSQSFQSIVYPIPRRYFLVLSTEVTQTMKAVKGVDIARAQLLLKEAVCATTDTLW